MLLNVNACDGLISDCFIERFKEDNIHIGYNWNWRIIGCCIEHSDAYGIYGGNEVIATKLLYNLNGATAGVRYQSCFVFQNQRNGITAPSQVVGCLFEHNGVEGPGYEDVLLSASRQHPIVIGSDFLGDATQTYGIWVDAGIIDANIQSNYFSGYTSVAINNHSPNTWIEGNQGYNPVGAIANPYSVGAGPLDDTAKVQAFPSSNTNYTVAASPKFIIIYGGTVTSISIDGVITGLTSGSFYLTPKQVLNVVWTVQPSSVVYAV